MEAIIRRVIRRMRNKHRTVNGWSIGEAGSYAKEHIKRKKSKAAD